MDPLTATMNALYAALQLAAKVWDATPKEQQVAAAADWAKFTHNIGEFFVSIQDKINASIAVKPTATIPAAHQ